MRKTVLAALASALFTAWTMQVAFASERHHVRKGDRAVAAEQLRNANNSLPTPAASYWPYSGYSAPAGQ
jgi:hypothetical protein